MADLTRVVDLVDGERAADVEDRLSVHPRPLHQRVIAAQLRVHVRVLIARVILLENCSEFLVCGVNSLGTGLLLCTSFNHNVGNLIVSATSSETLTDGTHRSRADARQAGEPAARSCRQHARGQDPKIVQSAERTGHLRRRPQRTPGSGFLLPRHDSRRLSRASRPPGLRSPQFADCWLWMRMAPSMA